MKKLGLFITNIALLSAFIMLLMVGYWSLYPYRPASYIQPDKVENKVVKQGVELVLITDFCRYMPVIPVISRSFVDGIIYNVPQTVSPTADVGCYKRRVLIQVPKTLPVGIYHLHTNFKYKVNPIRDIEILNESETFQVIK